MWVPPHFASLRKRRKRICEQKKSQVEKREWEAGGRTERWPLGSACTASHQACSDTSCSGEGVIIFSKGFLTYH